MNQEHYLAKLERNALVVDKAPAGIKEEVLQHIKWVRDVVPTLDMMDYDVRNNTIEQIHQILDADYVAMGFTLEENKSEGMHM